MGKNLLTVKYEKLLTQNISNVKQVLAQQHPLKAHLDQP